MSTSAFTSLPLEGLAGEDNFDEEAYLNANPDVARAVRDGAFGSGRAHFLAYGRGENRKTRLPRERVLPLKREKLRRMSGLLRRDLECVEEDGMVNYLSRELREMARIAETSAVSANVYDNLALDAIRRYPDGTILDCGAGRRQVYYSNVVNFEIVAYDTTDVLGVGEVLPFHDNSFDAIFSFAVLEHVRDPFRCASEICRVLKPGGELLCAVPFLQPLHGYPHHYYNMSHQGLRNLFDDKLTIEWHDVPESGLPIWSLTWILNSWAQGLPEAARREFLGCKVGDLLGEPPAYLARSFVRELSAEKRFELASVTMLRARKPA